MLPAEPLPGLSAVFLPAGPGEGPCLMSYSQTRADQRVSLGPTLTQKSRAMPQSGFWLYVFLWNKRF